MLPNNDLEASDSSPLGEKERLIKPFSKDSAIYNKEASLQSRPSKYEEDQKITFENLDPATSYTIRVDTIMNGIEIASKEAKIYQMG